jgi:hypothetical protein
MGHMVPCTNSVMASMTLNVMRVMIERGLLTASSTDDPEAVADRIESVLKAQGLTNSAGDLPMGKCLLLPGSNEREFALLLVSPCPADEFDRNLRRRVSPIKFRRTDRNGIAVPGRWLVDKFEELATNTAAPEELRSLARTLSRRADVPDTVLDATVDTVALTVKDADGSLTVIEALPSGVVITITAEEARAE